LVKIKDIELKAEIKEKWNELNFSELIPLLEGWC